VSKIIISLEGQQLREVELVKERTTLGRHPENDIVIDHRAVSGHHAAFTCTLNDAILEDVGSTNGTFVNGKRMSKQRLEDGDTIVVARHQLRFVAAPRKIPGAPGPAVHLPPALVEVANGPNAGKRLALTKPVTTLGTPGTLVVVIARQPDGYFLRHTDGGTSPLINGRAIGTDAARLNDGDAIQLAGTAMTFMLDPAKA
jgi:pSer/pThr/pTyr-binding forkhead associated (FHA) protein